MANLGDLVVRIVGDNTQFDSALDRSRQRAKQFADNMVRVGRRMTALVTAPIVGIGLAAVKSAADLELQAAAFETMLGSAEHARDMLQDLVDLSARTPFQLEDLTEAGKVLLNFGTAAEDVIPIVTQLGDIALGDSEKMKRLALAFGQTQSAGRLMGQDLLQMINAGFNPLQIIAQQTGESMSVLKERMSEGAISAEAVAEAFRIATTEGGQFYQGMETASRTLAGRFSTLKDNVAAAGRSFADILIPSIKSAVDWAIQAAQWVASLDEGTKRIIITVGGLAAALGPLALSIGLVQKALIALSAPPTGAIVLAVAAVVALTAAIVEMIRRKREYERQVYATADSVRELTAAEQEQRREFLQAEQAKLQEQVREAVVRRREAQEALTRAQERYGEEVTTQNARVLAPFMGAVQRTSDAVEHYGGRLSDVSGAIVQLDRVMVEQRLEQERQQETFDDSTTELNEYLQGLISVGDQAEETTQDLQTLAEQGVGSLNAAVQAYHDALAELKPETTVFEGHVQFLQTALPTLAELERRAAMETIAGWGESYTFVAGARDDMVERVVTSLPTLVELERRAAMEQINSMDGVDAAHEQFMRDRLTREQQNAAQINQLWQNASTSMWNIYDSLGTRLSDWYASRASDEEEAGRRRIEIERRVAFFKKAAAAMEATVATFRAVTEALPNIPMAIATGVAGLANIAAILATPLPGGGNIFTGPTPTVPSGTGETGPGTGSTATGATRTPSDGGFIDDIIVSGREFIPERRPTDRDFTDRRGGPGIVGGPQQIIVELDSQPILSAVFDASRDRRVLIDARSVV